jgi:hypothetical protein
MYLTATIDCLQMLSYKRGGHRETLNSARLTNRGYWYYQNDNLFRDCRQCIQGTGATRIRCTKVPQGLDEGPKSTVRCLIPPKEGAVVFGHRKLQKPFPAPSPARPGQQTEVDRSGRVMQWTTTAIRYLSCTKPGQPISTFQMLHTMYRLPQRQTRRTFHRMARLPACRCKVPERLDALAAAL